MSFLSIKEIKDSILDKKFSCEEIVSSCLETIASKNEDMNALLSVEKDAAFAQAKLIDQKVASGKELGPLEGVPIAIKDNILVKGWRVSAGSKILENYVAVYDATVIARLKNAGAILIGRANMDEFAMGSSTETSHFGPTKNPWNKKCVPGGSSGGSAAAVAAGFVPCALGTDTGGSVRQPASLCGVVGLKPTYGRVSRYGAIAMASSLDQIGVLARTVEDVARVMQVIEGQDPKDATSVELASTSVAELITKNVKGLRIGLPKEYFVDGMDAGVKKAVMEAVKTLGKSGAEIVHVSLPHAEYALAAYYIDQPAEASSNLGRYDGMRYGFSASGDSLLDSYELSRGEGFGPEVQRRIMLGSYVLSKGYYDAYYRKAMQTRSLIQKDFVEAFKDVDVIAAPTSPSVAWKIGEKFDDPLTMYLSDIYTISVNLAGIPAISVPCGFVKGLPVGLQFMGKLFDEATLYRVGAAYQSLTDWHTRMP